MKLLKILLTGFTNIPAECIIMINEVENRFLIINFRNTKSGSSADPEAVIREKLYKPPHCPFELI